MSMILLRSILVLALAWTANGVSDKEHRRLQPLEFILDLMAPDYAPEIAQTGFTPVVTAVLDSPVSDAPSNVPSQVPSDVPSDAPSDAPSDMPSDAPSDLPSLLPTFVDESGVQSAHIVWTTVVLAMMAQFW